jgi:hypothetical protein
MTGSDIRWLQRFDNFHRALLVLERGVRLAQTRELSELEQQGLIADGETWMGMIRSRNQSSHTYNLEQAQAIVREVIDRFHPAFCALNDQFAALADASR